ncbi:MAG: class I SAM-dependent methyltransferase [Ignavibacteriales bacterium]|nr:MAG: class I SAM-dependent methyltransferase [Ignavibacteriales bacterium]
MKNIKRKLFLPALMFIFFSSSYAQDVPFVPTPYEVVEGMLELADVKGNDVVYDLGCGDGRIVVVAAKKYGVNGVGVDSSPERIKESNDNAKENGVTEKVKFYEQNLFETDLREASVVTIYLLSEVNIKLRPKLFQELKPGSRVVSNSFDMDEWEPEERKVVGQRNIYLWIIPENFSGNWIGTMSGTNSENVNLELSQKFQKVNGTLQIGDNKYKISDVSHDGKKLHFKAAGEGDKKNELRFEGELNGNEITFTVSSYDGKNINKQNITLERNPDSITALDPALQKTEAAGK